MANWYINSVAYAAVTQWAASTAVSVGQIVRNLATPTWGRERCFVCTTAGTTGATEPSWNYAANNGTTTDNGVVWKNITGQEAYQAPGAWAAPFANLIGILNNTTSQPGPADQLFVGADHNEQAPGNLTIGTTSTGSGGGITVSCVDASATGHIPPQSGDVTSGAKVTVNGTGSSFTFPAISVLYQGISFINASIVNGGTMDFILSAQYSEFVNCSFVFNARTNAAIYTNNYGCYSRWKNVTLKFGHISQTIQVREGMIDWQDSDAPIDVSGTIPTNLIKGTTNVTTRTQLSGLDLSALGTNALIGGGWANMEITLQNCKLGAFPVVAASSNGGLIGALQRVELINCAVGTEFFAHQRMDFGGGSNINVNLQTNISVIRTGGASDGTSAYAWLISGSAAAANWVPSWFNYYEAFPLAQWNDTTGTPVNITVEGVYVGNVLPTNKQVWIAVDYFGSSSSPIYSELDGGVSNTADPGAALTASTEAWDSQAPVRANSTAYGLNDVIAVASNSGRVFFCTTAGTSAASEPAGYATAVDGTAVTDGTAVFTAGMRFKQTLSVTPQAKGFITVYVRYGFTAASRIYIDPKIVN